MEATAPSHEEQQPQVERLLTRVRGSLAQIIKVVAPAGFGKTTLTQVLLRDYDAWAVCDCAAVEDARAFCIAVAQALAAECPGRYDSLPSITHKFETIADAFGRRSALGALWEKPAARSLFIFENTENILNDPEVTDLFTRLLSTAPALRRVAVCSRAPLPIKAGRYLQPHRVLSITANDLALSDDEASSLLRAYNVSERDAARILQTARGWPVVLHLMGRLASDGTLDAALANSADIAFDDLFTYFLEEVLRPMDGVQKRALTACAAVPQLGENELSAALEMPLAESLALLRNAPLVYRVQGKLSTHPLLRELMMKEPSAQELAVRVANNAYAERNFMRAAELYVHVGDIPSAAAALARLSLRDLHSGCAARELSAMPVEMIRLHPKLLASFSFRVLTLPDLRLAEEIFASLPEDEDGETIAITAHATAQAQIDCKRFYEVGRILEDPRVLRIRALPQYRDLVIHLEARFVAISGRFTTAVPLLEHAYGSAVREQEHVAALWMANALALSYRWLGDRAQSLHWMDVAVSRAKDLAPLPYAETLSCAVWNAWFWDDDEALRRYKDQLSAGALAGEDAMFAKLVRAMDPEQTLSELPLYNNAADWRALLIAYCASTDDERRAQLLAAIDRDDAECPEAVGHAITALLHCVIEPHRRDELLARASAAIDARELPQLHAAIASLRDGKATFLDPFLRRFAGSTNEQITAAPALVRVEVLTETMLIDGERLRLTAREAALLAFLTNHRLGASREQIQDALWPDLDDRSARDSLYSLLYRLRKRANNHEIVVNIGNGYRFSDTVCVDVWELDMFAQRVARDSDVPAHEVREAHLSVIKRSYPHLLGYDWFSIVDFRIHEHLHSFTRRLIEDAFTEDRRQEVIRLARELLDDDACDEFAYTAMMRAYLQQGDRPEAARAFRVCQANLLKQLSAAPSDDMLRFAREAGIALSA